MGNNQEQPRRGRQGGRPKRKIMKGDKLGDKAAVATKSSPEGKLWRGSYFSVTGLPISEIASWSQIFRCHLYNSQTGLPSWFPFWASPGYSCCPVSQASLPPWFPFWAALRWAALRLPPCFLSLSSSFLLGCSWLQLPPCLPVLSSFSPDMILYLWLLCLYTFGGISRLVFHALLAYRT